MSLVEFLKPYKDFSYIPGDIAHICIDSTNPYPQATVYDATLYVREAIYFTGGTATYGPWRTSVVVTSISEPLIPDTKIPVYRIAALLSGGMTEEEVLQDFPSLSHDKIQYAESYAAGNQNYWRTYPSTSFKRRLREIRFL